MIAPARRVSHRILVRIATTDAHSDDLLRSREVDALSAQDRALTTTLVLGTLRWQLVLDRRIQELLARPDAKLSAEVATALRMGAYQLLYLDRVPAHAVIHDAVELVKHSRERGAAGMVNAVLRKLQSSQRRTLSAEVAHPAWMLERWMQCYGPEAAGEICRWDQEPAGITLRADPHANLPDIETEPGHFLTAARRLVRGDVGRNAARREGRVGIQDEASQLVAEVLAAHWALAPPADPGSDRDHRAPKVLDLCAAPGGKTAILAERLPAAGITAVDVSRNRLDNMRRMLPEALTRRMQFEVADAATLDLKPEWDLILCDVPCSGTGTIARNPEIRLRIKQADLARQHARQVAILRNGLIGLKAGGLLVYSTCSLEPEENEAVIAEGLEKSPGFSVLPIEKILDDMAERSIVTAEGRERLRIAIDARFLRTLPGVHPCDGFFAAAITKRCGQ